MAHWIFLCIRYNSICYRFRFSFLIYVKALNTGKRAMSKSSISEPTRQFKWIAAILVAFYSFGDDNAPFMDGCYWFQIKRRLSIAYPPKITFLNHHLQRYVKLIHHDKRDKPRNLWLLIHPRIGTKEIAVISKGMVIAGPSRFGERF